MNKKVKQQTGITKLINCTIEKVMKTTETWCNIFFFKVFMNLFFQEFILQTKFR